VNEDVARVLAPQVLGVLVRRGNDFATAEDAVQEALLEAHRHSGDERLDDPKGWLLTVASRKLIDSQRSEAARRRREDALRHEPEPGPAEQADDTLLLLFLCCHPALSPASAIALTLSAVGGLTTREIAEAFLVPEATMAQRISRAKRTVSDQPFAQPGDVAVVLRVLYLIFNEGYSGQVNLSAEAIRLTRQLALECDEPEVAGLLALMLLHHARRAARTDAHGALVPLDKQDRTRWNQAEIAEGVRILQAALARDRRGSTRSRPLLPLCTTTPAPPRRPTGGRSWPGTTNSSHLPTTRSPRSAARSRSGRLTARWPGWPPPRASGTVWATIIGSTRSGPTCMSGPDTTMSPPGTSPARRPGRAVPLSGTTSPSKRLDCAADDRPLDPLPVFHRRRKPALVHAAEPGTAP
jgi:RNA polymerase sigma factor (sigma-70 family)